MSRPALRSGTGNRPEVHGVRLKSGWRVVPESLNPDQYRAFLEGSTVRPQLYAMKLHPLKGQQVGVPRDVSDPQVEPITPEAIVGWADAQDVTNSHQGPTCG